MESRRSSKRTRKSSGGIRNTEFDDLIDFPRLERNKEAAAKRDGQVKELRQLVRSLASSCRPPDLRWPKRSELRRIHDLVYALLYVVRKAPPALAWKAYKAVDDHWTFNLLAAIKELVRRAVEFTPARPLEKYSHLFTKPGIRNQLQAFFDAYSRVQRGTDPSSVDWAQFEEVFKAVRPSKLARAIPLTPRNGRLAGHPSAAYVLFLELYHQDQQWMRRYWRSVFHFSIWLASDLQDERLLRAFGRFLVPAPVGEQLIGDLVRLPAAIAAKKKDRRLKRERQRKRQKSARKQRHAIAPGSGIRAAR